MDSSWLGEKIGEQGTWTLVLFTAIITLLVTKWGGALLSLLKRPLIAFSEFLYSHIAPAIPFVNVRLLRYRRHVLRSDIAFIESPIGPGGLQIPLEKSFAPLRMLTGEQRDFVELFSYAAERNGVIILGSPGSGKTTLMKNLIISILRGRCHKVLDAKIPVFIVLRHMSSKQLDMRDAIIDAFGRYHFPKAGKFVDAALGAGRLVIVLDGLDEVGEQHAVVVQKIQDFCLREMQRQTQNHILVTCREYTYSQSRALATVISNELRIEEFTDHHIRQFLKGWPAREGRIALDLLPLIQGNPALHMLCRNPLLLTIIAGLYFIETEFQPPRTRQRFFEEAIAELLINRPARRSQRQIYRSEDKKRVLEHLSLRALLGGDGADPESITRKALIDAARRVFDCDVDGEKLVDELMRINGIIKPTGDDRYTFNHRTFQEYLAAREAYRKEEPLGVAERFAARPELAEVLKLYCGMLHNIPQLNTVLRALVARGDLLLAAECLLNSVEIPDQQWIEAIVSGLDRDIVSTTELTAAKLPLLSTLSVLSLYTAPAFESARNRFTAVLQRILDSQGLVDAAALQSLIAKNRQAAEKLLPVLVHNGPSELRCGAVRSLRDIGSPEALDQLVRLLNGTPSVERAEAARMVAELINSRREEMTERQYLVPAPAPQTNPLWPLADYFPAALAIATARAAGEVDTKNDAINFTRRAITCAQTNSDQRFVRTWRGVTNAIRRERKRIALGKYAFTFLWFASITAAILASGISLLSAFSVNMGIDKAGRKPSFIDLTPLQACMGDARQTLEHLDRQYPREVTGLARLFPWNWGAEDPRVSTKMERDLYAVITQLSSPYDFRSGLLQLQLHLQEGITTTAPTVDVYACDEAATIFTNNLIIGSVSPHYPSILYVFFPIAGLWLVARREGKRRLRHLHVHAAGSKRFILAPPFIGTEFRNQYPPLNWLLAGALFYGIAVIFPYYIAFFVKPYMATVTLLPLGIPWAYGKPFAVGWRFAYGFKDETP